METCLTIVAQVNSISPLGNCQDFHPLILRVVFGQQSLVHIAMKETTYAANQQMGSR